MHVTCHVTTPHMSRQVYTPVWDAELSTDEKRDSLMDGTYQDVKVVPILVTPESLEAIYSRDLFNTTLTAEEHLRRAKLEIWPRSGEACQSIPHPTIDGVKYPHGSLLDTTTVPVWQIHPLCVRQWLQVRGLHLRSKVGDRALAKLFKRARRRALKPMTLEVCAFA